MSTNSNMIKADGARGWFKLSREIAAGMIAAKLNGCEAAIVMAVALDAYGQREPNKVSRLTIRTLSGHVPYVGRQVSRSRDALIGRGILTVSPDGHFGINTTVSAWQDVDTGILATLRREFPPASLYASDADEKVPHTGRESHSPVARQDEKVRQRGGQPDEKVRETAMNETRYSHSHHQHHGSEARIGGGSAHDAAGAAHEGTDSGNAFYEGGGGDPDKPGETWTIKACIGYAKRRGMNENEAVAFITPLIKQITASGIPLDGLKLCNAVDGVLRAFHAGASTNPPGALINGYYKQTWQPPKPGELYERLKDARNGTGAEAKRTLREIAIGWWNNLSASQKLSVTERAPAADRRDLADAALRETPMNIHASAIIRAYDTAQRISG